MPKDFKDYINTPDHSSMYDTQDIQDNKVWAALSYVSILFFLPLVVNNGTSKYGRYHANQGFLLFLFELVCALAKAALGWIPVLGALIEAILALIVIAYMIFGIYNAVTGKARELPFIGNFLHVFDK